MRSVKILGCVLCTVSVWQSSEAQSNGPDWTIDENGTVHVNNMTIPVPSTVSPTTRNYLAHAIGSSRAFKPNAPMSADEIAAYKAKDPSQSPTFYADVQRQALVKFPVDIEKQVMAGVPVAWVRPKSVPPKNRDRLLINLHGGGFCGGGGIMAEAVVAANVAQIPVLFVDYRLCPKFPFPAALDDTVAVYRKVLETYKPDRIGIYGGSAGAALALSAALMIRDQGLPLPGAVGALSPAADLRIDGHGGEGDSYSTLNGIDLALSQKGPGAFDGTPYASGQNPKNPLVSPVYGDFSKGFPPTFLLSGTRDIFLSNTVRTHVALRTAGIPADLFVLEAMPHGFGAIVDLPETEFAFREMAEFFDKYLK
jgi:acetyl esterase/lipase